MISSAIVSRYANALADVVLAPDSGIEPAQAIGQLRSFAVAVKSSPELRTVLASPAISAPRKRIVIKSIAGVLGLSTPVRNFVLVLSDRRRIAALSEVANAFELALDMRLGFVSAQVQSASELTAEQKDAVSARLAELAGARIRMRFEVDPALIGGLAARIGSRVYDGSVRGQLAELRGRLAATR
jgi:F-type H+-transporting ATPase subunit delta